MYLDENFVCIYMAALWNNGLNHGESMGRLKVTNTDVDCYICVGEGLVSE